MMFDYAYAISLIPALLRGLIVTFEATIGGMVFAVVLGLAIAIGRMVGPKWLRFILVAFVEFVRTTPLLVQLFFLFYVLPEFGVIMSPLVTGIIGLGLHQSSYMSEAFIAGVQTVPKGQWEAARALNYGAVLTWRKVVMPQAIPVLIPVMANYTIITFKETALLATITAKELMGMALNEAALTYRYLETITLVGVLYTILSVLAQWGTDRLEKRMKIK